MFINFTLFTRNIDKNKLLSSEIQSAMYLIPTLDHKKKS